MGIVLTSLRKAQGPMNIDSGKRKRSVEGDTAVLNVIPDAQEDVDDEANKRKRVAKGKKKTL